MGTSVTPLEFVNGQPATHPFAHYAKGWGTDVSIMPAKSKAWGTRPKCATNRAPGCAFLVTRGELYFMWMDHVAKHRRSEIMRSIASGDTQPERTVRSIVHSMGYRFRLRVRTLPGKPDIVLKRHKKIVFIHGCFWHGHARCLKGRPPKTNLAFWLPKLAANKKRDRAANAKLRRLGWRVLVIWQCQLRRPESLLAELQQFLES